MWKGFPVLVAVLAVMPSIALAQFSNPLNSTFVIQMMQGFLYAVIYVGTPAVAALLVWSGFLFVSARGNPEGITKAKKTFLIVIIGGTILFGLWAIATLASNTLSALTSGGLLLIAVVAYFYVRNR